MKTKLKNILEEADSYQLLEILTILCEKYSYLDGEIEFILNPRNTKNPQSYYNKLVKKSIDTNSWSKFPNKGVKGLNESLEKLNLLQNFGNSQEASKLARSILDIIARCKKNYNTQNVEDLLLIKEKVEVYL